MVEVVQAVSQRLMRSQVARTKFDMMKGRKLCREPQKIEEPAADEEMLPEPADTEPQKIEESAADEEMLPEPADMEPQKIEEIAADEQMLPAPADMEPQKIEESAAHEEDDEHEYAKLFREFNESEEAMHQP